MYYTETCLYLIQKNMKGSDVTPSTWEERGNSTQEKLESCVVREEIIQSMLEYYSPDTGSEALNTQLKLVLRSVMSFEVSGSDHCFQLKIPELQNGDINYINKIMLEALVNLRDMDSEWFDALVSLEHYTLVMKSNSLDTSSEYYFYYSVDYSWLVEMVKEGYSFKDSQEDEIGVVFLGSIK